MSSSWRSSGKLDTARMRVEPPLAPGHRSNLKRVREVRWRRSAAPPTSPVHSPNSKDSRDVSPPTAMHPHCPKSTQRTKSINWIEQNQNSSQAQSHQPLTDVMLKCFNFVKFSKHLRSDVRVSFVMPFMRNSWRLVSVVNGDGFNSVHRTLIAVSAWSWGIRAQTRSTTEAGQRHRSILKNDRNNIIIKTVASNNLDSYTPYELRSGNFLKKYLSRESTVAMCSVNWSQTWSGTSDGSSIFRRSKCRVPCRLSAAARPSQSLTWEFFIRTDLQSAGVSAISLHMRQTRAAAASSLIFRYWNICTSKPHYDLLIS